MPWAEPAGGIEPYYPKGGGGRRPPVGVERMLWIHFLQHWFNLSEPSCNAMLCIISKMNPIGSGSVWSV